ncbi:hypothetical protein BC629DRAFT_88829 [Irpex lacteus]|nr:hypothetical protein BC629DRAFT_88829 [Irpex lacteus]
MLHDSTLAALAWTTCNTVFHLNDEVVLIWSQSNSQTIKWTYVFIRYAPILHEFMSFFALFGRNTSSAFMCITREWVFQRVLISATLALLIAIPLMTRVRSLRHKSRNIMRLLIVLFVAEVIGTTIALGIAMSEEELAKNCLLASSPSLKRFLVYWLLSLVFQAFLFVYTLRQFLGHAREIYSTRYGPLIRALMKDGAWVLTMVLAALYYQLKHDTSRWVAYL